MNRSFWKLHWFLTGAFLLVAPPFLCAQQGEINLTGFWQDNVGGKYLIRHVGDHLYWVDDHRPRYINIFSGTISGRTITGEWADLPGGQLLHNGTLELRIESNDRLVKTSTGGVFFGGAVFTREAGTASAAAPWPAGAPGSPQPVGIAGTWQWSWRGSGGSGDTTLTINEDGTFSGHGSGGNWQLAEAGKRTYKLTWKGGSIDTVSLAPDGQHLEGANQFGTRITATRTGSPQPPRR